MNQIIRKSAISITTALVIFSAALSTASTAVAAIPFLSEKEIPSLAPMLEETTPAIVSIAVEGTQTRQQQIPEMFRYFFGNPQQAPQERPFRGLGSNLRQKS